MCLLGQSIWPEIWKSNLLEYTDYELVPQEKKTPAALVDKRINYRNVFVVLETRLTATLSCVSRLS